jgi:hypothetical protein
MPTLEAVKTRPILYSSPMVKALLSGRKTQTRRVIFKDDSQHHMPWRCRDHWQDGDDILLCRHGKSGDRLWVRETTRLVGCCGFNVPGAELEIEYAADGHRVRIVRDEARPYKVFNTVPSIFMPRWASRITLEITEVRVQRIQSISDADILAEGIAEYARSLKLDPAPRLAWIHLWESINGKRDDGAYGWHKNPWTWCITFRRIEKEVTVG